MVGVDECVQECVKEVVEGVRKETTYETRVGPVMLSRCMRGGKTTVLCRLFDALQGKGYNPIYVSFSGANLARLDREQDTIETLAREITISIMKSPPNNFAAVQCPMEVITDYLKTKKKVVLLIDELDVLLKQDGREQHQRAGKFFRCEFLDPADRLLVFTTHRATTAGVNELLGPRGGDSVRAPIPVQMPMSYDLTQLRNMAPECASLTPSAVAYYSGIPSLIFSVEVTGEAELTERFRLMGPKPAVDDNLVRGFLSEFFTGVLGSLPSLRQFDSLTEYRKKGRAVQPRLRWILGYAGLMCEYIARSSRYEGFLRVASLIQELKAFTTRENTGDVWEIITRIAILLRCLDAQLFGRVHRLLGLQGDKFSAVYSSRVRGSTVAQAKTEWEGLCAESPEFVYPPQFTFVHGIHENTEHCKRLN